MNRIMLRGAALAMLLAGAALLAAQPPEGRERDKKDRPPGLPPGGPPRFQLGRVLPPFAVDQLELTDKQKVELAKLEKDVKARLEKILTAEQRKKLETMRPGPGRRPSGRPEGPPPGGERRPPPPDRPEKEKN